MTINAPIVVIIVEVPAARLPSDETEYVNDSLKSTLPVIRLKIQRRSSHPWVFQKMIEWPAERIPPGMVVDVEDRDGQWVGRGFFNGHSRIALRILTAQREQAIDAPFVAERIRQAVSLRREALKLDDMTDAYRVIHSEGDNLSGLVVDRFA